MIVFKHEAILSFVDRLIHDREFAEWFVAQSSQALSSYNLTPRDLQDVSEVLGSERHQPEVARALQPTLRLLVSLCDDADVGDDPRTIEHRFGGLERELQEARLRIAQARQVRPRPWWRFW